MTGPHPGVPAPRPSRRHRRALLPLGALLAASLAACSGGSDAVDAQASALGGTSGSAIAVAPEADCLAPQVLTALGFDPGGYTGTTHPDAPEATPLPTGFTAASALLCSTGETLTDAAGRWAAVTASRLEGDVAPLVAALRNGSTLPAARSAAVACPPGEVRSDLWLVDALGSAVRVALPGDGCGNLPAAVGAGLAALDAVDVEHYPVELVAPSASASPTSAG